MKELAEYRANLMKRLEEAVDEFRAECLTVDDPYAPLAIDGWTVHQIAAHTRDVDKLVYGSRARRTAMEENPEFPNFDGEAYMSANYHANAPLDEVLDSLVENVRALVKWLRTLSPEAWSRVSRHTTLGRDLTLQTWVEKDLAHIEEHLGAVKKRHSR
ncbi:MAG TPA: DinB family protein [Anaerolineales bacterium]|nr:DinB family protein [Anaerolineales bacterium]